MTELLNVLKNDVPALSFFCVGSVFALFYLVLSFFYIAKEKKRRNAFDVVTTVINIVALVVAVVIGLCAVFYRYPIEKIFVSGEYAAEISVFGFSFTVPAFGAVLKFITSAYGISLYAVLLFALLLFVIVHPLRIARKGAEEVGANAFSLLEEDETAKEDKPSENTELLADEEDGEISDDGDDTLLDELSEENLSDKIDEIVTRAKIDVSASDDVSPYMIDESDVSDVLEMLTDEVTDDVGISDEVTDEETAEESGDSPIAAAEVMNDEVTNDAVTEERPEKEEKKTPHVSDYVIPVTVRTISRRKTDETEKQQESTPEKKTDEKPAVKKTQKPATKKSSPAPEKETAYLLQKAQYFALLICYIGYFF